MKQEINEVVSAAAASAAAAAVVVVAASSTTTTMGDVGIEVKAVVSEGSARADATVDSCSDIAFSSSSIEGGVGVEVTMLTSASASASADFEGQSGDKLASTEMLLNSFVDKEAQTEDEPEDDELILNAGSLCDLFIVI
jgi:hypothetical protein